MIIPKLILETIDNNISILVIGNNDFENVLFSVDIIEKINSNNKKIYNLKKNVPQKLISNFNRILIFDDTIKNINFESNDFIIIDKSSYDSMKKYNNIIVHTVNDIDYIDSYKFDLIFILNASTNILENIFLKYCANKCSYDDFVNLVENSEKNNKNIVINKIHNDMEYEICWYQNEQIELKQSDIEEDISNEFKNNDIYFCLNMCNIL